MSTHLGFQKCVELASEPKFGMPTLQVVRGMDVKPAYLRRPFWDEP
jgi:hypothetical protein